MAIAIGAATALPPRYCDTAIVGGGPGGLYSALRLANASKAESVCVFEALDRFGGRVHSVRVGKRDDLVVDLGAYRFARELTDITRTPHVSDMAKYSRL